MRFEVIQRGIFQVIRVWYGLFRSMALKKRYISPYTTIAAFAHVKRRKLLLVIRTQTN